MANHSSGGSPPADGRWIDFDVAARVQCWCHYLNVTADELRALRGNRNAATQECDRQQARR